MSASIPLARTARSDFGMADARTEVPPESSASARESEDASLGQLDLSDREGALYEESRKAPLDVRHAPGVPQSWAGYFRRGAPAPRSSAAPADQPCEFERLESSVCRL
jgi:hypothetical protein